MQLSARSSMRLTGRIAALAGAAILAGTAVGSLVAQSASASTVSDSTVTATQRTVVRPVTSSGHAVSGYTVKNELSETVDCSPAAPSPSAVDNDIVSCFPDAAYGVACWKGATAHHVLCLDNPRRKVLVQFKVSGPVPQTRPQAVKDPLALTLADGTYCGIRFGGAGPSLKRHPQWAAYYYCSNNRIIWGTYTSPRGGLDRSGAVWTAQTTNGAGKAKVYLAKVAQVWLVGTAS